MPTRVGRGRVAAKRLVYQRKKGPIDPMTGQRVRAARQRLGMTQGDLAGDDLSKGFISLVETGHTRMSLRAAQIIANRLGVPVSALLEEGWTADRVEDALSASLQLLDGLEEYLKRTRPRVERALADYRSWRDGMRRIPPPPRT